jgi:hypothetical protein
MAEVHPYIHNTAEGVDVKEYLDHRLDRGVYYAVRVSEKQLVTLTRFSNLFSYFINVILNPMEFWRGWRQGTQVRDWCTTQLPPTAQSVRGIGATVLGQRPSTQPLPLQEPSPRVQPQAGAEREHPLAIPSTGISGPGTGEGEAADRGQKPSTQPLPLQEPSPRVQPQAVDTPSSAAPQTISPASSSTPKTEVEKVSTPPSNVGVHTWTFYGGIHAQEAWDLVFFAYDISVNSQSTPNPDKEGEFSITLNIKSEDEYRRALNLTSTMAQELRSDRFSQDPDLIYDLMNREVPLPKDKFRSRLLHYLWDHTLSATSVLQSMSFKNIFALTRSQDLREDLQNEGILEPAKSYVIPRLERGPLRDKWVQCLGVALLQDVSVENRVKLLASWDTTRLASVPMAALDKETIEGLIEKSSPKRAFGILVWNYDFRETDAFLELVIKDLVGDQEIWPNQIPLELEERVYTTLFQRDRNKALKYYNEKIKGQRTRDQAQEIWKKLLPSDEGRLS